MLLQFILSFLSAPNDCYLSAVGLETMSNCADLRTAWAKGSLKEGRKRKRKGMMKDWQADIDVMSSSSVPVTGF